ncbi:MAG: helix-turn-helix domain-containing protein [Clostridia bacterium]|nr:helix-turn-helix domain-containing protein [Clostridia bacterium]
MSVYESILQGLNEAIAYENGNLKAHTTKCTVMPVPELSSNEIKDIRLSFGMTQAIFAEVLGVSVKTVEAWEAGTNKPIGIARRFLSILQADPELLIKTNIVTA